MRDIDETKRPLLEHLIELRRRLLWSLATLVVVLGAAGLVRSLATTARASRCARLVTVLFVAQFSAGVMNLVLLAPVTMQLVHLLLADATWIALVLMTWEAAAPRFAATNAAGPSRVAPPSLAA